ncbi:hypothetical protein F070042J6_16020 [Bacteroides sp. f07]|uniref:hypothetical protein n=1 Tax=Bacteroides sp. f07 TaxID=3132704 RepID=UPI0034C25CC1
MRILIISKEAWRDEQNGGNVLSNIFQGFDAEFAQIFCNEQLPNNKLCKKYYQITDKMMVNSILGKGLAGMTLKYDDYPVFTVAERQSYGGVRWAGGYLRLAREVAWALGRWNEGEIKDFVTCFNPDIIFAPCYGNHYMHKMLRLVKKTADVSVVSYISDDFYGNNQLNFSPLFWINHFALRRNTRSIFKLYSLVYTMTQEQKEQCERDFGANMKILCKCGEFLPKYEKKFVGDPIRFIYGGGIYINRWKTLKVLSDAIRKVNAEGANFRLDIYTNTELTESQRAALNDGKSAFMHDPVSMSQLMDIYHNSDIALHVEGFDSKSKRIVRLSFSTKIVDCLDSGCAVMAICDDKQAGGSYLRRNECAICVHDLKTMEQVLRDIWSDKNNLIQMQHKAFEVGRKNHLLETVSQGIRNDFWSLIK